MGGNHLGSWHLSLDYNAEDWGARIYAEHFFEDHSGMFFLDYDGYGSGEEWNQKKDRSYVLYDLKDIQLGAEVRLNKFPWLNNIVFEYINTQYQSGSVYHDHSQSLPDHVGGKDNYYNHGTNTGWPHAGHGIGSPLLLSPVYTTGQRIYFMHNRVKAYHVGIMGQPMQELGYRMLWTHEKSLGTYNYPLIDPQRGDFLLAELSYTPRQVKGLSVTASYGMNHGTLLGNSHGAMLTLSYNGILNKKK